MRSHEEVAKAAMESKNSEGSNKIAVLQLSIDKGRLSRADRIKGVTRSLVVDALAVVDDMWEECQESPDLRENCYLLYHYLGYLKRFCEGRT